MNPTSQEFGSDAEKYLQGVFRSRNFSVIKPEAYNSPYDLLVNSKRVEIKAARPLSTIPHKWLINIQRHSKVTEDQVDVYAILLDLRHLGKVKPLVLLRK